MLKKSSNMLKKSSKTLGGSRARVTLYQKSEGDRTRPPKAHKGTKRPERTAKLQVTGDKLFLVSLAAVVSPLREVQRRLGGKGKTN